MTRDKVECRDLTQSWEQRCRHESGCSWDLHWHVSDAASSLLGFTTQTLSAMVGAILGHTLGSTAWPLAIAMMLVGGLSLLLWTLSRDMRVGLRSP
jgi:hypothetical protein